MHVLTIIKNNNICTMHLCATIPLYCYYQALYNLVYDIILLCSSYISTIFLYLRIGICMYILLPLPLCINT